jgi:hypothetical protein
MSATTKVVTGKVRFSYAYVFEPRAMEGSDRAKYSVSILIPKTDSATLARVKGAIDTALKEGIAKLGGKIPPTWKDPLRDGDIERPGSPEYAGHMFVNANSDNRPGIVDINLNPIIEKEEFYSGCYGRASINFYVFNKNGNKGVACGLNNLQKLADGERLSGGSSAEDDFGQTPWDDDLM